MKTLNEIFADKLDINGIADMRENAPGMTNRLTIHFKDESVTCWVDNKHLAENIEEIRQRIYKGKGYWNIFLIGYAIPTMDSLWITDNLAKTINGIPHISGSLEHSGLVCIGLSNGESSKIKDYWLK